MLKNFGDSLIAYKKESFGYKVMKIILHGQGFSWCDSGIGEAEAIF